MYYLYLAGYLAALVLTWAGVSYLERQGYTQCQAEVAQAKETAQKEANQRYEAALAWGTQVSNTLAEAQRINNDLRVNHARASAAIPGMCPVGLLTLHDSAAAGAFIPDPTGETLRAPGFIAASALGSAIADNYAVCRDCCDRLAGWIEWYRGLPR